MSRYVLRIFDPTQKVAHMIERDYSDHLDALEAAEELAKQSAVEVWDDKGRIAKVKKDCRSSESTDPLPG
jgi:hypothetical protein